MSTQMRLSTEALAVGYGGTVLIGDIALRVGAGRVLTLIGPNGSGKSTILKTLSGHLHQLGGTVLLDGKKMESYSRSELARELSVLLTDRARPERMTCEDVVAMGRYPYTGYMGLLRAEDREKIDEALHLVEIAPLRNRAFLTLSDGQRQQVLLARAICQEPNVLLLDEPTSFLDVHHKIRFLEILRRLATERGIAVVLSMHELEFVRKISDEMACIKEGRILKAGAPEEILTEALIEELFDLPAELYRAYFTSGAL